MKNVTIIGFLIMQEMKLHDQHELFSLHEATEKKNPKIDNDSSTQH